jgi:16S rRNA (cytosine967-C5)-methyltransferase
VLLRVRRDGAYAAAALDHELDRYPQLSTRERALTTELVYGCLRVQRALLEQLERFTPRGLAQCDRLVVAHLTVAAYQLLLLDRIPDFAAVDAAVSAIRRTRGTRLGGFANAVLRKLAGARVRLDRERAVLKNAPEWLHRRLQQVVGAAEARALLGAIPPGAPAAFPDPGTVAVRMVGGRAVPAWLADAPPGRVSPRARLIQRLGDPRRRSGWAQGDFVVQEEGAQVVALALGARRGERVLDACAGRGQKASLLAEQVGPEGELWVADLHPAKLRALQEEFQRLRLPAPSAATVDWTVGPGPIPADFDRVLVDAPCSGIGALRRRPEITQRLQPQDPQRLGDLAVGILRHAARRVRAHGRVVFAVCSVLPEEGEGVVQRAGEGLAPAPFDAPELQSVIKPDATSFRLLPGQYGTEGYFVASFVARN